MRRPAHLLFAACAAPLPVAGHAAAEDVVQHATDDGKVKLPLPASWEVERRPPSQEGELLELGIESDARRWVLSVWDERGTRDERNALFVERLLQKRMEKNRGFAIATDPMPHVITDRHDPADARLRIYIPRMLDRPFSIVCWIHQEEWDSRKTEIFAGAKGLWSSLGPWLDLPEGYRTVKKGGWTYLLHPDVKSSAIGPLQKMLSQRLSSFARRHGKDVRSEVQVAVHAKKEDARNLFERASNSSHGYAMDVLAGRLYAVPVDVDELYARTECAAAMAQALFVRRYGSHHPEWAYQGEAILAFEEERLGQSLPVLSSAAAQSLPATLRPFGVISADERPEDNGWLVETFAYTALFVAGPAPYRQAYRHFLADFDASGDWTKAAEANLLTLDPGKLQSDYEAFRTRTLKIVLK